MGTLNIWHWDGFLILTVLLITCFFAALIVTCFFAGRLWEIRDEKRYLKMISNENAAMDLLEEWHDLHSESNRLLDADNTFARTQKFLIENGR